MIKNKIFRLVEKGSHGSKVNLIFDYAIMILIVLNFIAVCLETISSINSEWESFFKIFEYISVIIFTLEYLMRIYVADLVYPSSNRLKSIFKFITSPFGLVDLLAIIPFYLPFFIRVDLRFLRILRLIRFFRILKINRYNKSIDLIYKVIKEKKNELIMTGFVTILVLLIASVLIYYVESNKQTDKFSSIPSCFWWTLTTLTSLENEGVHPLTALGKFLSVLIAIVGIGLVALPTGIISAGFIEKLKKKEDLKQCPHCGKTLST